MPDAARLREQAMDKLASGDSDEAQRLFGLAAQALIESEPKAPGKGFAYGRHVHEAADIIQQMCRKRFTRCTAGQMGFAKLFRGYRARNAEKLRVYRLYQCAKCIQDGWWKWLENKLEARIRLQCFLRQTAARWNLEERRRRHKAAIRIQLLARKIIAMNVFKLHLLKFKSAIKISKRWRGYATRWGRYVELRKIFGIYSDAQTSISRVIRGVRGRRISSERRKQVAHYEQVRYKKEKRNVDAAVKLAMSRAQFYLESEEGRRFVEIEREKIKKAKKAKEEVRQSKERVAAGRRGGVKRQPVLCSNTLSFRFAH
jgi:hypothetical protein